MLTRGSLAILSALPGGACYAAAVKPGVAMRLDEGPAAYGHLWPPCAIYLAGWPDCPANGVPRNRLKGLPLADHHRISARVLTYSLDEAMWTQNWTSKMPFRLLSKLRRSRDMARICCR